ncbi:zinc finger protein 431-like [Culex pipiens pallens]|uniref:zinc finger protein 431-like n=1 Tax=Culex pipiens pallens TaxID=42434 RepID=UPI0019545B62|nr:zinc finger protein 431-like [Culex pipiens pallens]
MFFENESDPEETPPCRLCLETEVDELISLFARCSSQQKLVSEMISELTKLSQYEMGDMSQYICGRCLEQLDKACTFRKRCRDTNRFFTGQLLRNSLKNVDGCCRLCEDDEPDELISVFCICEGKLIAELIGRTVGLKKPVETDGLPQHICGQCLDQLSCAAQLREMILENDARTRASHVKVEEDSMNAEELFNVAEEGWSVPGVTPKVRVQRPKPQPPPEEEVDPFIYLDVPGEEGEKLQEAFETVAEGEFYEQLLFGGLICCCGKLFGSEKELQTHRGLMHAKQEVAWSSIKCNDCKKRFKSKWDLDRHRNEREKKQFYRCKICNVLTKEMTTLQIHFEFTRFHPWLEPSEEEQTKFDSVVDTLYEIDGRCCACEGEFEDAEALLEHVKEAHYDDRDDVPMFQCTICYSCFSDRKSLHQHQQSFSGTRTYQCRAENCTFKTDQRAAIRKHVESGLHCDQAGFPARYVIKELIEEFFCCMRDCNEVFPSREELEQHSSVAHEEKRTVNYHFSKDADPDYVCDLCKRLFPSAEAYKRHARSIIDRKVMCTACSQRFSTREQLTRHEKYYHLPADEKEPQVVHQCPHCPATLRTPVTLQQHIKSQHEGTAGELCKTCGKIFNTKTLLKSHETNRHMKIKPYRCNQCPISFGSKFLLQRHMIGHTDQRYPCNYCGKEYRYPNDTKRHEQAVHLNEKPEKCEYCGKCFIRARDLRLHISSHTGVKLFQCMVTGCDYSTNVAKQLAAHVDEQHQMEVKEDSD